MAQTPLLNLEKPIASEVTFAELVNVYNDNLDIIDGLGNLRLSDITVDGNLGLNSNLITQCLAIQFIEGSITPNFNNSIFFEDGELHIRDGGGRIIQVTNEGDLAAPGGLRGTKITESPILPTSGLTLNASATGFVEAIPDHIADKYTLLNNGFRINRNAINPLVGDASLMGFVADLEVNGVVVDTVVVPYGVGSSTNPTTIATRNQFYALAVGAGSQGIKFIYRKGGGTQDFINVEYISASLPANSKIVFYEAQIRGQRGASAEVGATAQTIYYGLTSFVPINDTNRTNSQNSATIYARALTQVNVSNLRRLKQIKDLTLGGAYLQFTSGNVDGLYSPWFAVNTDDYINLFVVGEENLWVNAGNVTVDNNTYSIFVRTLPLLKNKVLNTFIKNYE